MSRLDKIISGLSTIGLSSKQFDDCKALVTILVNESSRVESALISFSDSCDESEYRMAIDAVSKWNVWCDIADEYKLELNKRRKERTLTFEWMWTEMNKHKQIISDCFDSFNPK